MVIPVAASLTISGPADANPVGKQISNWGGQKTDTLAFAVDSCPSPVYYSYAIPNGIPVPGLTHVSDGVTYPVYPTEIPGLGYIIAIRDPNATRWTSISPPRSQIYPGPGTGTGAAPGSLGFTAQVKFIATGQIKAGTYPARQMKIATLRVTDKNGTTTATDVPLYIGAFTLTSTTKACTITQGANQIVNLPTVEARSFTGPGSNSWQSAPFSISLKCDAGVSVYATMSDVTTPSNTTDILSLTADSTATGLGLRIFTDGASKPVRFGPDSSVIGNTNQWFVGLSQSSGTLFTLPFTARYVQSGSQVGTGTVSARSSITFSYQ
ncbi:fimbrial protein [Burkholderia ambifaria]|uniref:fimbrial protein n=1 Tax=Burkholderia ambifaria TaxID=152480 RepID=UPI00158BA63A|nr:fimbrial protein [Burkholderia ambifaria]UEP23696.1 type 1 fimbrial protein [Burkholderia ambifaria]WAS56795.1 type 1 fimbrial protein [Burkholderia ambifaria]WDR88024.1 fimbrial protein [Burkholderia ambifaria]WDS00753.1 fimbrial protein [Burkholderia ambifaria]